MPNLLITDYCNRACPYCFAKDKVGQQKGVEYRNRRDISLEHVNVLIQFLKRSDHPYFSILGGEPTLHPQFTDIVDRAIGNRLKVKVFTNGLMSRKIQKYLFRNNVDIVLNINEPDETPFRHLKKLENVYENLGPNIRLGFNIYKEDFNLSFLFKLIDKHHMHRSIRLGISQPILNRKNIFIAPNMYRKIGKKLVGFAEEADRSDIRFTFDCGFILCMFSKTDIGKLFHYAAQLRFVCGPAIDFDPDLNIWPCFPLSSVENRKLAEFANFKELVNYYEGIKRKFSHIGMFTRCNSCKFLKRKQCHGGCISHKLRIYPYLARELFE